MNALQAFIILAFTFSCRYAAASIDKGNDNEITQRASETADFPVTFYDEVDADQLTLVTRYAGAGYNLIRGAPEGDFNNGGVDPGIKITRHIFSFTYNKNKEANYLGSSMKVPDQVTFHAFSSCASSTEKTAYSGSKSYQSGLAVSVEAEGSYGFYSFSASLAFAEVKASTEEFKKVNVDKKAICNYGRVRYLDITSTNLRAVTEEFYAAVNRLPATYNENAYFSFIEDWGTHIIIEADLGNKTIERFVSNYEEAYSYLETKTAAHLGIHYEGLAARGSVSIDIDTLNEEIETSSTFGSMLTTIRIGKEEVPQPIKMKMKQIFIALDPIYWGGLPEGKTYASLGIAIKKIHLMKAFNDYKTRRGVASSDPPIDVPVEWPGGQYSLLAATGGCPEALSSTACRYQDNEDNNNKNAFSAYFSSYLKGTFGKGKNTVTCYCTKTSSIQSVFKWPKGRYCIARYGDRCPDDAFSKGSIFWDDEDDNNKNRVIGPRSALPSGTYSGSTIINFCCREDGSIDNVGLLPTTKNFVLWQYKARGCQKIHGMVSKELFMKTDDEDSNNKGYCRNAVPYDLGCNHSNHHIFICHYRKK